MANDKKYPPEFNVSFWKKDTGNLLSHGQGLSAEQIAFIQKLQVGDRLILWANNAKAGANPNMPTHSLKVFKNKEQREAAFAAANEGDVAF